MTIHPVSERTWESLNVDEKLALKQAAAQLTREFAGLYGNETIERFLASSYDQFADRATVTKFLPLLAERFARQRLHALARVEGLHADGKPVVVFLCTHNAGRSQMALGFFQALTGDNAVAWSGGSEPGREVNPSSDHRHGRARHRHRSRVPQTLDRRNRSRRRRRHHHGLPRRLRHLPRQTLRELGTRRPHGHGLDTVRRVRDELERRVRTLISSLHL